MTRVCLLGEEGLDLRYELLSRETARDALATYDLSAPFANSVAVETVSLGAAVALLNDLDWHLARFVREAIVLEPSVSDEEWLSRALASAVRDDEVASGETGRYLKLFGIVATDDGPAPVEPMFVARTGRELPGYDLRDVDDTLAVRVTEAEFGA